MTLLQQLSIPTAHNTTSPTIELSDIDHQSPAQTESQPSSETRPHADIRSIAIVGLGYVGLPTALAFTSGNRGIDVIGIDISDERLQNIHDGRVDLIPADIARLDRSLVAKSIQLSNDTANIANADAVLICVPTPVDRHLTPDLRALRNACDQVVRYASQGQIIVLTSTSYVGTTDDLLVRPLQEKGFRIGHDIFVAFSPERIDPGNTTMTQETVPRVVGGVTEKCAQRASDVINLIAPTVHEVSSPHAAEFAKLFENTYRAVNIALVNEMADVGRTLGLDIMEVITAAATKPYGFSAFRPGPGIGGHCIPCDPHYLLWQLRATRESAPVVETAMQRSAARPSQVVNRAIEQLAAMGKSIDGAKILIVGVAYKPNVQDVRESPALEMIPELISRGACVEYHDPLIDKLTLDNGVQLESLAAESLDLQQNDLTIVHTLHDNTNYTWIAELPSVLDTTYRLDSLTNRVAL